MDKENIYDFEDFVIELSNIYIESTDNNFQAKTMYELLMASALNAGYNYEIAEENNFNTNQRNRLNTVLEELFKIIYLLKIFYFNSILDEEDFSIFNSIAFDLQIKVSLILKKK